MKYLLNEYRPHQVMLIYLLKGNGNSGEGDFFLDFNLIRKYCRRGRP